MSKIKKDWDMIRLFESINGTKVKGSLTESFENEANVNNGGETLKSYLEAALWADSEDGNPDFEGKTIYDFDSLSVEQAKKDIADFMSKASQIAPDELASYDKSNLGHNIWLSRNGHGAGFFDDNNDKLQDIARNMQGKDIYVGDDGKVYIQ